MTEIYKVGLGHDLALVDLDNIEPQPNCQDGVQPTLRDFGADGIITEQGLTAVLEWPVVDGELDLQLLYSQFDLEGFTLKAVTVYLPDFERIFHRYNGYAIRPLSPNWRYWGNNIRIVIRDLYRID